MKKEANARFLFIRHQRTSLTGALSVVTLAQPALASATASAVDTGRRSPGGTHDTLPIIARPATTRSFTLRTRPRPAGSSTCGDTCSAGGKCVVWRRNPPSNAAGSAAYAGAFFVDPSKCRRESGGALVMRTSRGALAVCAWTRKSPPVPEEELVDSEMLEWTWLHVGTRQ